MLRLRLRITSERKMLASNTDISKEHFINLRCSGLSPKDAMKIVTDEMINAMDEDDIDNMLI